VISGPCGALDSTLMAAWTAAAATVLVALVAWVQLTRFNKNAVMMTTLKFMDDFDKTMEVEPGISISPITAIGYLKAAVNDQAFFARFRAAFANPQSADWRDQNLRRVYASLSIFLNYLVSLNAATSEGLISIDYVFEKNSGMIYLGRDNAASLIGRPCVHQVNEIADQAKRFWDQLPAESKWPESWPEGEAGLSNQRSD
jgi:hypothetical protein